MVRVVVDSRSCGVFKFVNSVVGNVGIYRNFLVVDYNMYNVQLCCLN